MIVLGLCAAAQMILYGVTVVPLLAAAPSRYELFTSPTPQEHNSEFVQAYRSLPRLAEKIPRHARTLLLSQLLTPVQFEFYFMPRPFRKLLWFPLELIDLVKEHTPHLVEIVQRRNRDMRQRRILYSRERLLEEIEWAEYLIVFQIPKYDPMELPRNVTLIARDENAALYRVGPN